MSLEIVLADKKPEVIDAWEKLTKTPKFLEFSNFPKISVHLGDIFAVPPSEGNAVVSPANSFGFMDGGIDLVYLRRFGLGFQKILQQRIKELPNSELLVGQALAIPVDDLEFPYYISAPTMIVPQLLEPWSLNPYLAVRAATTSALAQKDINRIIFPGMGTGIGEFPPERFAWQFAHGIHDALFPKEFPGSIGEAQVRRLILLSPP